MQILPLSTLVEGAVNFTECVTTLKGKESSVCKPIEPILADGEGELIAHSGTNYILFTPLKSPFTTVEFGGFCALPKRNEVNGSLVLECGHLKEAKFTRLDCANHETTKLLQTAPAELFKTDGLKFGENPTTLDGSAEAASAVPPNFAFLEGEAVEEFHSKTNVLLASHATGTLLVPAQNLEIKCAKVASDPTAPMQLLPLSTLVEGAVNFTECATTQNGKELSFCKPVEPILASGEGELIAHSGTNYILFAPMKSEVFTKVKFTGLCALPKENEVKGSLILECGHLKEAEFIRLDCANHETTKLLQPAPAELFKTDGLKFGENPATLDGSAEGAIVAGAQEGLRYLSAGVARTFHSDAFLGVNYVLVEPSSPGGVFTIMKFGGLCSFFGSEHQVRGSLVFECGHLNAGTFVQLDCADHQVTQLLRQAPVELFPGHFLSFGEMKTPVDGIVGVSLVGPAALIGLAWGGDV